MVARALVDILIDLHAKHRDFFVAVRPSILFKDFHHASLFLVLAELGCLNLNDRGAVADAQLFQPRNARRQNAEGGMLLTIAVLCAHRREDCHQHDKQNDERRDNGCLVLLKAQPRILEKADGLAFKFLVVDFVIDLNEGKILSGQVTLDFTHGSSLPQCGYAGLQCRSSDPPTERSSG